MVIVWVGMARRIQEWHFKGVTVESVVMIIGIMGCWHVCIKVMNMS